MRRLPLVIIALGAAISLPGVADAQQASLDGGPLVMVAISPDAVSMISGFHPLTSPTAPVEVITWTFRRGLAEGETTATLAARTRIDCGVRTIQTTAISSYRLDGELIRTVPAVINPMVPAAGTVNASIVSAVCAPRTVSGHRGFPDRRAAQAYVDGR